MGGDAMILDGVDSEQADIALLDRARARRLFGWKETKRHFTRAEMDDWLKERSVTLISADLDKSPIAFRRLPKVLSRIMPDGCGHALEPRLLHGPSELNEYFGLGTLCQARTPQSGSGPRQRQQILRFW
jgi:hypothetical protein